MMDHWTFVTAAYAITGVGSFAMAVASYLAMRRAERAADALKRK